MTGRLKKAGHWYVIPHTVFVILFVVSVLVSVHADGYSNFFSLAYAIAHVSGLVFSILAWRRRRIEGLSRRSWLFLAVFFGTSVAEGATFGALMRADGSISEVQSWLDLFYRVITMPLLLGALIALSDSKMTRSQRLRLSFDFLVVAGGGFMVIWYAYINPALGLDSAALPNLLAMMTYPPLDLMLILGVCLLLIRGAVASSTRVLLLLLLGMLAYLGSDLYISYQTVHMVGWRQNNLGYLTSLLPLLTIAAAAVEQSRPTAPAASERSAERRRTTILLPSAALVIGFGMLLFATIDSRSATLTGLVFGALAMVVGVQARQLYALRENEQLLATDALTGLPNRSEMSRALRRALERGRRDLGTPAMLLIDLNGFKQVNDVYGHEAGDQMLMAFGQVLRDSLRAGDTPARLGGDEFAVVLPRTHGPSDAIAVASKIVEAAARTTPLAGKPVTIRASVGISLADPAERDVDTAVQEMLRRADGAMYTAKRSDSIGWHLDGWQPVSA